jgi:acyl carrier protein
MPAELDQVIAWILARHPELTEFDPDCDLIDNRLIDSMSFLEFIALIERLTGRPVDPESLNLDDFRTLNRIERAFFSTG